MNKSWGCNVRQRCSAVSGSRGGSVCSGYPVVGRSSYSSVHGVVLWTGHHRRARSNTTGDPTQHHHGISSAPPRVPVHHHHGVLAHQRTSTAGSYIRSAAGSLPYTLLTTCASPLGFLKSTGGKDGRRSRDIRGILTTAYPIHYFLYTLHPPP